MSSENLSAPYKKGDFIGEKDVSLNKSVTFSFLREAIRRQVFLGSQHKLTQNSIKGVCGYER